MTVDLFGGSGGGSDLDRAVSYLCGACSFEPEMVKAIKSLDARKATKLVTEYEGRWARKKCDDGDWKAALQQKHILSVAEMFLLVWYPEYVRGEFVQKGTRSPARVDDSTLPKDGEPCSLYASAKMWIEYYKGEI